jgi:two-component system, chemotaxis family, chemotaxis protein CheY
MPARVEHPAMNRDINILVVDDFSTMRRIIRNILRELGYHNIVEAADGDSALSILSAGSVDLLITDWNMPGMPGLELLKRVRESSVHGSMPVLMLTAEAKREQIVEAARAGANGYIIKPFTTATLKSKIEMLFPDSAQASSLAAAVS